MTSVATAVRAPRQRTRRDFFTRVSGGLVALLGIVLIGTLMAHSSRWTAGELHVLEAINTAHTPFFDALTVGISVVFSPPFAATIALVVTVLVRLVTRRWGTAVKFAVIVTGSWLGSEVVKVLVHRQRPDASLLAHPLVTETSYSFPSGHTAFVASLALGLIIVARGRRWRSFAIVVGSACGLLVAFSRVYLGVHYVSDVVASLVYSAVAVSLLYLLWNRYLAPRFR